jgi:hypothetical protein
MRPRTPGPAKFPVTGSWVFYALTPGRASPHFNVARVTVDGEFYGSSPELTKCLPHPRVRVFKFVRAGVVHAVAASILLAVALPRALLHRDVRVRYSHAAVFRVKKFKFAPFPFSRIPADSRDTRPQADDSVEAHAAALTAASSNTINSVKSPRAAAAARPGRCQAVPLPPPCPYRTGIYRTL